MKAAVSRESLEAVVISCTLRGTSKLSHDSTAGLQSSIEQ